MSKDTSSNSGQKLVLGPLDGWHRITSPEDKQLHYFYKGKSLCVKYPTKPSSAIHDNVEEEKCQDCKAQINPLLRGEIS